MITIQVSRVRSPVETPRGQVWQGHPGVDSLGQPPGGFGALQTLSEARLESGASWSNGSEHDGEVITYVRRGGLAYRDQAGDIDTLEPGEFLWAASQRALRPPGVTCARKDDTHAFQILLAPTAGVARLKLDKKCVAVADRRGKLCLIASPDARDGSLRLQQDMLLYSALYSAGQHVEYKLQRGRCAWLHVVHGELALRGVVLSTGDGAGAFNERAVSMNIRAHTELLLVDSTEAAWNAEGASGGR